jgi:hypothetical protein
MIRWCGLGWFAAVISIAGCDLPDVSDRVSMELSGGAPKQRIDLDPTTVAPEIDNNISVDVSFELEDEGDTPSDATIVFTRYRVDYKIGEEEAPFLAGEIDLEIAEGSSDSITVRAASGPQLSWVAERYSGAGELDVQARVHLAGIYDDEEAVLVTHEFIATFADYE